MASADHNYPDYLNPFGSDEEHEESDNHLTRKKLVKRTPIVIKPDDYPDHLSPFGDDDASAAAGSEHATLDDYDDSLNPFGDREECDGKMNNGLRHEPPTVIQPTNERCGDGNPFEEIGNEDAEQEEVRATTHSIDSIKDTKTTSKTITEISPQPESLEPPPIPLPRTKSLLKKEKAQKNRQTQPPSVNESTNSHQINSLMSTTSSTSSSSITNTTTSGNTAATTGSFQRRKNKRNAPPVPVNFKRQVSGSLDAIEQELNEIGDELAVIEKESNSCQEILKETHQIDEASYAKALAEFAELIRRKNSISRRQKELMYKKRELKLDQIHSDIEYELRMIGNKQLSHRTAEDEIREKELLKKLVEIVEEKSDIVENLNKDSSCDSHDIEEALRRLNITSHHPNKEPDVKPSESPTKIPIRKNEKSDKINPVIGTKLSKIATLLPKSGTLKGTMKIKRKRFFKKCDSHPIEQ